MDIATQIRTNRELYLANDKLNLQHPDCGRSLEAYLLTVLNQSLTYADRESLTLAEFYELLASGFTDAPAPFDDAWRDQYDQLPTEDSGYAGWHATLICQLVDLREMDECGTLQNEMRCFGVSAPRKSYWYNFSPAGYLECAMAGSFGGWAPGDDTDRQYVPGQVVAFDGDGSIQSVDPEDVPNPIFEIPIVTWEAFRDFLDCGQGYE